jgi:hypothetical protein
VPEGSVSAAIAVHSAPETLVIARAHGEDDLGVLAGGYYPYYGYGYSSYGYGGYPAYAGGYGYSSGMGESGATTEKVAATGPGTCGTYLYWKDGKCNDARSK